MGAKSKFCINCRFHELSVGTHKCWRQVKPTLSLVTGKLENAGLIQDCVVERLANHSCACREEGQYFEEELTDHGCP